MLIKDVKSLNGIAQHLVNIFESKESRKWQVHLEHSHKWGRVDPLAFPPSNFELSGLQSSFPKLLFSYTSLEHLRRP